MKILIGLLIATAVASVPGATRAQESPNNEWGIYVAPVVYGYTDGTSYNLATSGGGMDIGVHYTRFLTPGVSMRVEARYGQREMEDAVRITDPLDTYTFIRLSETFLQIPLMVEGERRVALSDHELRMSTGGGLTLTNVISQKLYEPSRESLYLTPADSYRRFGVVFAAGATFTVQHRSAISLRFRFDYDLSTFDEDEGADVIRRFWSTGFCAGYEYAF